MTAYSPFLGPQPPARAAAPLRLVEYVYYGTMLYGVIAVTWGISIGLVGAAALGALAVLAVLRAGTQAEQVFAPVTPAVAAAISFVIVQTAVHGEALMNDEIRLFVSWVPTLIVIAALVWARPGFLHRFARASFLIGLVVLPYVKFQAEGVGVKRAGLERSVSGELANPNGLAAWFGFCCIYFLIYGLESRRASARLLSWAAALGSLFVVALTVSRGPLFASAVAALLALRRMLKRSFIPALVVLLGGWVLLESGLLEGTVSMYSARLETETGRFLVWPWALKRFAAAPFAGYGMSRVATHVPYLTKALTPHNSFLFLALAAGIVPVLFYALYWVRAFRRGVRFGSAPIADAAFRVPLLVYSFLISLQLNNPFLSAWMIVSLAVAASEPNPALAWTAAGAPRPPLWGAPFPRRT